MQSLAVLKRQMDIVSGGGFDLRAFCHKKQHAFASDPQPYATAVTSRRAGKTVACAADLLSSALRNPGKTGLYITLSRVNAKRIVWPTLKQINQQYKIGGESNESELMMTFPNGSKIYLSGIKDKGEIENFRGMAIKRVYLDEAQSMRPYVKELIDDVLEPTLIDHDGTMRVIGTPGPVPVGYFYEISQSAFWSHHDFTIWDNPFITNPQKRLDMVLQRRGITIDHPSIQREWFGRWALDVDALVVRYNADINDYQTLPSGIKWDYVVVADLGFDDADAIAVIAFSDKYPDAFLVEEIITVKQGITPLAAQLTDCVTRYKPFKVLGDFGALGKKIASELQSRFGIPIEAAEKSRKLEYIELMNDSLRTGRLKAKKTSRFAQDAMLLEWDKENPEKPKISDRYHSDIVDSVLYGHRELMHWLWKEPEIKPQIGSPEHYKRLESDIWDGVRETLHQSQREEAFWKDSFEDES